MWLTALAEVLAGVLFGRSGAFLAGAAAGALLCATWAPALHAAMLVTDGLAALIEALVG